MSKWPSKKDITQISKELSNGIATKVFDEISNPVDLAKYKICEKFVLYMNENELSQKELAQKLNIDAALVSKITHYHFERFTLDKLLSFLSIIYPSVNLKIDNAS